MKKLEKAKNNAEKIAEDVFTVDKETTEVTNEVKDFWIPVNIAHR